MSKSEISEELDDLTFRFLDIIQSIINKQNHLQDVLRNGYVNMAKARYIMGNKHVSTLQISEKEVTAKFQVCSEVNNHSNVECMNFKITEECNQDTEKSKDQKVVHRKVKSPKDLVEGDSYVSCEQSSESGNHKNENHSLLNKTNPLNWFGILVPQSLRTCQSHFVESLDIIAELATLKSELVSVCVRYKEALAMEKGIKEF